MSTTIAPTASGNNPISVITWVFFALFLFLAVVSRYLAKLVIALTRGFPIGAKLKLAIKRELEYPLFLGFNALFLYLSMVVFFPVRISAINEALYYIVRLYCWIVIFIACVMGTRFLMILVAIIMENSEYEDYISQGVVEFLGILRVVALALILLVLITSYISLDTVSSILDIFGSINLISATLVVMFAPVLRSLFAGLTILSDRFIKNRQVLQLVGVTPLGRVQSVQLRNTKLRSFQDGSIIHIPNIMFLRYAAVNASLRGLEATTMINVQFPIDYTSDTSILRRLLEMERGGDVSMALDADFVLHVRHLNVPVSDVDKARRSLMLDTMKLFHDLKIKLRY